MSDYERGQWRALNDVLALINTFEYRDVPKKELYAKVMELRPAPDADRLTAPPHSYTIGDHDPTDH